MNPLSAKVAVLLAAAALVIAVARFERLCMSELSTTADRQLRYLTRRGWAAIIVLAIPIGGIVFLYCGRSSQ